MIDFVKNDLTPSRKTLYWHRIWHWYCNLSAHADVMNRNLLRVIDCRMKGIADLEIYTIARNLSKDVWNIYDGLTMSTKMILWNQFIRSTDSVWANIAEWFWRFHYLDSIKFYYNARWSLYESKHWLEISQERKLIPNEMYDRLLKQFNLLAVKLNNFIRKAKEINK